MYTDSLELQIPGQMTKVTSSENTENSYEKIDLTYLDHLDSIILILF